MEEETRIKEKVETDMEEENRNIVAMMTMKTRWGTKTHQCGNAKIAVQDTLVVVTNRWDELMI